MMTIAVSVKPRVCYLCYADSSATSVAGAIVVIDNLKVDYAICVQAAIFCGRS